MIVIVTGSRNYGVRWRIQDTIANLWRDNKHDLLVRVGDCPTGIDEITLSFCKTAVIDYKVYEANWDKYGRAAGPIRNHRMVDDKGHLCVAWPQEESKGTKDCAEYAHSKGIPVWFPDLPSWAQWAAPIANWEH